METNVKKNTDSSLPEIKKIGKAKDLISIIPEIESKIPQHQQMIFHHLQQRKFFLPLTAYCKKIKFLDHADQFSSEASDELCFLSKKIC